MSNGDPDVEGRIRTAIELAAKALEEVYETVGYIQPSRLTVPVWQRIAAQTGVVLSEFERASGKVSDALGLGSGQARILTYLRSRVGEHVRMEELRGVSAIGEWARRVRELRVEQGWPIATQTQRPDLGPGIYVLEVDEPNEQIAADWRLAKRMRNLKRPDGQAYSGKDRGLEYLRELSPRAADADQLHYVMKIKSYARRLRELDEEGWQIISNIDDPTLAPGSYRLASLERRPPRARQAIKLRYQILDRDNRQCRSCGATPERDRVPLQIHHKLPVSQGGTNDTENLITLCANCHAGRHAVEGGTTRDELLDPASEPDTVTQESLDD
ncbi:HNH endonuclease [Kribbella sp. NBC_00889]|uniref:HNH endonuclease n=1 Tax=Kribbella sp. NBC_00889 TaxID=2975974 RepID=UPI00386EFF7F|nr:HNH endonuclease [Kribbella sp. NBC_00889]